MLLLVLGFALKIKPLSGCSDPLFCYLKYSSYCSEEWSNCRKVWLHCLCYLLERLSFDGSVTHPMSVYGSATPFQ